MAAAREQAEERRLDPLGLEVERRDVAMQVIDRHQRQVVRPSKRLRGREADEQRTDETRPLRDRDGVDLRKLDPGLTESLARHRDNELEVSPRGHLRHDTPEASVQFGLGGDDVGEDPSVAGDDRRRGLVTGRFETENPTACRDWHGGIGTGVQLSSGSLIGSFHMISASSRLSV